MELVFTLARSIEPLGTIDAVLDALDSVAVGIEIVDLGATGLPSLQELVALNAYAGRIAVGPRRRLPRDESREILAGLGEGELTLGKEVVPIDPNLVHQAVLNLSWLAASAWTSGRRLLGEGDVIFSGSLTGMRPLNQGASVRARIAGLGDLRLRTG